MISFLKSSTKRVFHNISLSNLENVSQRNLRHDRARQWSFRVYGRRNFESFSTPCQSWCCLCGFDVWTGLHKKTLNTSMFCEQRHLLFCDFGNMSSSKKVCMPKLLQWKQKLQSTIFTAVLIVEDCYKSCCQYFNQIQIVIFITSNIYLLLNGYIYYWRCWWQSQG